VATAAAVVGSVVGAELLVVVVGLWVVAVCVVAPHAARAPVVTRATTVPATIWCTLTIFTSLLGRESPIEPESGWHSRGSAWLHCCLARRLRWLRRR
jgi:hypothetical protein